MHFSTTQVLYVYGLYFPYQQFLPFTYFGTILLITVDKSPETSWIWWYKPVIPALWKPRQEDGEFQASLGY
jgi:hypothetical protein